VDFELEIPHDFTESEPMMTLKFTYWEAEEGGFEGHLDDYPDFWTQGETLDELKEMLASLHKDIEDGVAGVPLKHTGELGVA